MNTTRTFLSRATTLFVVSLLVSGVAVAGCGRSDLLPFSEGEADAGSDGFVLPDGEGFADSTQPGFDAPSNDAPIFQFDGPFLRDVIPPPQSCGDHVCDDGESCSTCPEDCGECPGCGDGLCEPGETCLSCAPDCGACPSCGDGKCTAPDETCFTCPEDCGNCLDCGDGICEPDETCASCQDDCGPCAVCGNNICEGPYETCGNCPEDCGECSNTCLGVIKCAAACASPPSVACILDCGGSGGCPQATFRIDQLLMCAIANLATCGGFNLACIEEQCTSEITQCAENTCDDAGFDDDAR